MAAGKLVWGLAADKAFENGLSHGVVYPKVSGAYPVGEAWNGLVSFTEQPEGAEPSDIYADDGLYVSLRSVEKYGFSLEAYTYPDSFAECDGSAAAATGVKLGQQTRKPFGFSCRTNVGNADDPEEGYMLHLIYGATASPSERAHSTVNESPETNPISWDCTTVPVSVTGFKPTASITIDSRTANAAKLAALETILYGKDAVVEPVSAAVAARLPLPDEVITLMTTI